MAVVPDQETWARVLEGDRRAFGVIWDRHRDRVFWHLVAMGNSRSDAEDLTAAVFLELWRRRAVARFVDGSVLPWLIVTAQNVAKNAARARRRYRALLQKLPPPGVGPDPADVVAERGSPRARHVRNVLTHARAADRDLVALTVLEGFTVADAAATVGLSEPTARMRLSRLRARLNAAPSAVAWEGESS